MNIFQEIPANRNSITHRKVLFGVGINDALYQVRPMNENIQLTCPYYRYWSEMLRRCYDPKYHTKQPTYIVCSVCVEWLTFSNFKKWMMTMDWEDKCLDKDLVIPKNKIYSPKTCVFISQRINNIFQNRKKVKNEDCISGVHWHSRDKKYQASCHNGFKRIHIGYFKEKLEAETAYISFKKAIISDLIKKCSDLFLQNVLVNIHNNIEDWL
jgi:hypothetical protein